MLSLHFEKSGGGRRTRKHPSNISDKKRRRRRGLSRGEVPFFFFFSLSCPGGGSMLDVEGCYSMLLLLLSSPYSIAAYTTTLQNTIPSVVHTVVRPPNRRGISQITQMEIIYSILHSTFFSWKIRYSKQIDVYLTKEGVLFAFFLL